MKDVAERAGVGIKTVSRVVNGEAYVAEATAARVERAMNELNYRRDLAAGSLRRSDRRSLTLGLLLANVANPFDAALHRAAEDVAQELGVSVLSASLDEDADREQPFVHALATRRIDGLILMPASHDHAYLAAEIAAGMSVVFVDRPPEGLDVDCVVVDNQGGARQAVEHLASFGHRRIAFLGDRPTLSTASARLEGFLQGVGSLGLSSAASPTIDGLTNEYVAEAAARVAARGQDPPTALFSRPEPRHRRRHPGAPQPRPRARGGARGLRRHPARRPAAARHHRHRAGRHPDRPAGRRTRLRPHRRRRLTRSARRRADGVHRPRSGEIPAP